VTGQLPSVYHLREAMVVVLEPGLDRSRWTGLMLNIRDLPGVASVTDLGGITRETLDVLLAGPRSNGTLDR
jgi:hypothetical protein